MCFKRDITTVELHIKLFDFVVAPSASSHKLEKAIYRGEMLREFLDTAIPSSWKLGRQALRAELPNLHAAEVYRPLGVTS